MNLPSLLCRWLGYGRVIWRRLRLRELQLRLDDWRGICRLCQQGAIVDEDGVLEAVVTYRCVVLRGCYHEECALAAREAHCALDFAEPRGEAP